MMVRPKGFFRCRGEESVHSAVTDAIVRVGDDCRTSGLFANVSSSVLSSSSSGSGDLRSDRKHRCLCGNTAAKKEIRREEKKRVQKRNSS